MKNIQKNLSREVEKGKRTKEDMDAVLGRIKPTLDIKEAAADADIVVEVVIEVMECKKERSIESWRKSYRPTVSILPIPPV